MKRLCWTILLCVAIWRGFDIAEMCVGARLDAWLESQQFVGMMPTVVWDEARLKKASE